jgi:lipoyl(octanoyl) transferase
LRAVPEWRILPFQTSNAFENMAIDEAILIGSDSGRSAPTLRFYGWNPPAVSVGYFQDINTEVNLANCRALGVDIVRRPTGGKAVLHENEITYSVVSPRDNPLFPDTILGTYKVISDCLVKALSLMGIEACIADRGLDDNHNSLKSICFSEPSRFELLVAGKKICGSAQVRTKNAFLQHGSLLTRFEPERAMQLLCPEPDSGIPEILGRTITSLIDCPGAIKLVTATHRIVRILSDSFRQVLGIKLTAGILSPWESEEKRRLLEGKYRTGDWNFSGIILP